MKRPWQVWLLFAICALAAVAGMAWLSRGMIESDRELAHALAERDRQRRINQAVWRMDGQLAPLVAEEVARPASFYTPPAPVQSRAQQAVQMPFVPEPYVPPHVVAYFEHDLASGEWSSPSTAPLSPTVYAALSQLPLPEELTHVEPESQGVVVQAPPIPQPPQQVAQAPQRPMTKGEYPQSKLDDFNLRQEQVFRNTQQELSKAQRGDAFPSDVPATAEPVAMKPVWVDNLLLLVRRTERYGRPVVQGVWLDWPKLKGQLLREVEDLVPGADLVPASLSPDVDVATLLASLPVSLVVPAEPVATAIRPPTRVALAIGWGAVMLAIAAAGLLLRGVLALSERRAAFVSSVTHELRTPLTTFRMYAEMLAGGMVPDERRREYLETLQVEADRLTHLVENVLAYARLERGRRPQIRDRIGVADLAARLEPRLTERLARAGMHLGLDMAPRAGEIKLLTDVGVVEQIVLNLIDNAAKYANGSPDGQVLLSIATADSGKTPGVQFMVRDFGPGFSSTRSARRSLPFGKSAQQAAESAPGVGLGLALCRRLARELGGRLTIEPCPRGACVALWLPSDER